MIIPRQGKKEVIEKAKDILYKGCFSYDYLASTNQAIIKSNGETVVINQQDFETILYNKKTRLPR